MGKYSEFVYRFDPSDGGIRFDGSNKIAGSRFTTGYELIREPEVRDSGFRSFEADEYLVFGAESMDSRDFDAEVRVTIGSPDAAETYVIDRPATVRIPAGIQRGPVEFVRVGKPVFYQDMRMQDVSGKVSHVDAEVRDCGSRIYEKLVFFNVAERSHGYFGQEFVENTEQVIEGVGIRGACQIPGAKAYLGGGFTKEPVFIDPYPHKHDNDEYLIFLGSPADPFDMDVHIEMTLGNGDDAETFDVDQPTIIRIPAGTWHCPLNFMRVDKPFFFEVVLQQGNFGGIYRMPGGDKPIYYNGMINCILEPDKHCTTCQKCLSLEWNRM